MEPMDWSDLPKMWLIGLIVFFLIWGSAGFPTVDHSGCPSHQKE
jgi:hypothetical protein